MDRTDLASIRREYALEELSEDSVSEDPVAQFGLWMEEAIGSQVMEPTAMTLSTVSVDGQTTARVVLLKGYDANGFVFFTNYLSKKATDISEEPRVSLHFLWRELERQVGITGTAAKVDRRESEEYFATRPRASQIGAWASEQSKPVGSRKELEDRVVALDAEYADREIPCPPDWGGYLVEPVTLEFWQGRRSRLHDRLRYDRCGERWAITRLSP
jgi:pyridoxamine 5'-phosphate oxidase